MYPVYAAVVMISEIRIRNFKSIRDLALKPGRVTVLIGENGSGKSNILEAIAFAAAASANKLDPVFLASRGIRVAEATWMKSAFPKNDSNVTKRYSDHIRLDVMGSSQEPVFECSVQSTIRTDDGSFDGWMVSAPVLPIEVDEAFRQKSFADEIAKTLEALKVEHKITTSSQPEELVQALRKALGVGLLSKIKNAQLGENAGALGLSDFMIYAPENTTLRTPPPESAIQPLGTKGEGLFKLLQTFGDSNPKFSDRLPDMKERLRLFGWFDDFLAPDESAAVQARLQIRDRWLAPDRAVFDQRSANEGFLYLLFYFALLMSWRTPRFFALDNVDNALNPKLCSTLMRQIVELAKKYDKQVICTTHNPAILDGLNINDDHQRLFTVQRDSEGHTVVNRVQPPKPQPGKPPMKLSAAFLAGHIGGLPDHF